MADGESGSEDWDSLDRITGAALPGSGFLRIGEEFELEADVTIDRGGVVSGELLIKGRGRSGGREVDEVVSVLLSLLLSFL